VAGRSGTYLWQSVIGLGFLSGVWTALGIDPEEVFLTTLGTAITAVCPDPAIRTLFLLLPTALFLISAYGAYRKGKAVGIIAVIVAYVAGLSVLVSLVTMLVFLLFAVLLGYLATNRRLVRKLTGR